MSADDCTNPRVTDDDGAALRVADAMVARPKTLPADATAGDLRALFDNPHVVSAVVVDGAAFVGTVGRDELPADVADDRPARALARRDVPTIAPDAPLAEAVRMLDADGTRRLVVLDADGTTLRGLLCLTRDRDGFCQS